MNPLDPIVTKDFPSGLRGFIYKRMYNTIIGIGEPDSPAMNDSW